MGFSYATLCVKRPHWSRLIKSGTAVVLRVTATTLLGFNELELPVSPTCIYSFDSSVSQPISKLYMLEVIIFAFIHIQILHCSWFSCTENLKVSLILYLVISNLSNALRCISESLSELWFLFLNSNFLMSNYFEIDFVIKTNDKKSRRFDPSEVIFKCE